MKRFLILFFMGLLLHHFSLAQQPFIGIQNGPRKGMASAIMNPAELSNLGKKVEVNFFSAQIGLSNNVLSFQDMLRADDLLDLVIERSNRPINLRTDLSLIGPSAGFKVGTWAFGIATQAYLKADVVDLDPTLGQALFGDFNDPPHMLYAGAPHLRINHSQMMASSANTFTLNYPNNQRFTVGGWGELDLMAAKELLRMGNQSVSVGTNLRLIFPSLYANLGMSNIRGTLVEDDFSVRLTDAYGELNIAYSDPFLGDEFGFGSSGFRLGGIGGVALDLGATYTLEKEEGKSLLNAGISLKNIGGMSFRDNSSNTTYSMNIPEGEYLRIDDFDGDFENIEQELLATGYFNILRDPGRIRVNFPTMVNAYAEYSPINLFHVSLFIQHRLSDERSNNLITQQNMVVVTPRLVLGKFEIYSPWSHYQVAGINGGFGLQFGGFFVGSHSIITGLLADTRQVDVHLGLSWGFGKNN